MTRKLSQVMTRKVQRLGASSLIVTLPKSWARKHGIDVGDPIIVYDEGNRLILTPSKEEPLIGLNLKLNHASISKHAGRLCLCSYLFGFDYLDFEHNRPINNMMIERISRYASEIPGAQISMPSDYEIRVEFPSDITDVEGLLSHFGRELGSYLGRLALALRTNQVDLIDEESYRELLRLASMVTRAASRVEFTDSVERRLYRGVQEIMGFLGLSAVLARRIAGDVKKLHNKLTKDEAERLSFLLELLEVVASTLGSGVASPSVKKAEEAYWKLRDILDLEKTIEEVLENMSPQAAYLLARTIDLARTLEFIENAILCFNLIRRYAGEEEK